MKSSGLGKLFLIVLLYVYPFCIFADNLEDFLVFVPPASVYKTAEGGVINYIDKTGYGWAYPLELPGTLEIYPDGSFKIEHEPSAVKEGRYSMYLQEYGKKPDEFINKLFGDFLERKKTAGINEWNSSEKNEARFKKMLYDAYSGKESLEKIFKSGKAGFFGMTSVWNAIKNRHISCDDGSVLQLTEFETRSGKSGTDFLLSAHSKNNTVKLAFYFKDDSGGVRRLKPKGIFKAGDVTLKKSRPGKNDKLQFNVEEQAEEGIEGLYAEVNGKEYKVYSSATDRKNYELKHMNQEPGNNAITSEINRRVMSAVGIEKISGRLLADAFGGLKKDVFFGPDSEEITGSIAAVLFQYSDGTLNEYAGRIRPFVLAAAGEFEAALFDLVKYEHAEIDSRYRKYLINNLLVALEVDAAAGKIRDKAHELKAYNVRRDAVFKMFLEVNPTADELKRENLLSVNAYLILSGLYRAEHKTDIPALTEYLRFDSDKEVTYCSEKRLFAELGLYRLMGMAMLTDYALARRTAEKLYKLYPDVKIRISDCWPSCGSYIREVVAGAEALIRLGVIESNEGKKEQAKEIFEKLAAEFGSRWVSESRERDVTYAEQALDSLFAFICEETHNPDEREKNMRSLCGKLSLQPLLSHLSIIFEGYIDLDDEKNSYRLFEEALHNAPLEKYYIEIVMSMAHKWREKGLSPEKAAGLFEKIYREKDYTYYNDFNVDELVVFPIEALISIKRIWEQEGDAAMVAVTEKRIADEIEKRKGQFPGSRLEREYAPGSVESEI